MDTNFNITGERISVTTEDIDINQFLTNKARRETELLQEHLVSE